METLNKYHECILSVAALKQASSAFSDSSKGEGSSASMAAPKVDKHSVAKKRQSRRHLGERYVLAMYGLRCHGIQLNCCINLTPSNSVVYIIYIYK